MISKCSLVPVLALLMGAAQDDTEIHKIQGTWTVEVSEKQGQRQPEAELKEMRVVIRGATIEFLRGDKAFDNATFKLDPAKSPKAIDFFSPNPKEKRPSRGIFEIDGETLKLCYRLGYEGERPAEFASKAEDGGIVMLSLRRKKQ